MDTVISIPSAYVYVVWKLIKWHKTQANSDSTFGAALRNLAVGHFAMFGVIFTFLLSYFVSTSPHHGLGLLMVLIIEAHVGGVSVYEVVSHLLDAVDQVETSQDEYLRQWEVPEEQLQK